MARKQLWEAIRRMNVGEKLINVTQKLYKEIKTLVKSGNELTKKVAVTNGLWGDGHTNSRRRIAFNSFSE